MSKRTGKKNINKMETYLSLKQSCEIPTEPKTKTRSQKNRLEQINEFQDIYALIQTMHIKGGKVSKLGRHE